ncbi:MAG: hypothetical protein M3500_04585 [Actinomycetota bacterium]|jgi:hypothetical protein|nr:hypothetical protein [Actinomycetota bacterium]
MEDRWSAIDDLLLRAFAGDDPDRARLAELAGGTEIDPSYRDDRVDALRAWLTTRGEL